jgi:protoheme IX farnesyltransferase
MSGPVYLAGALVLNGIFIGYAVRMRRSERTDLPMRAFRYSINYLGLMFALLLVDHYL